MSTIVDLYIFQANPSFLGPWVRKSKELLPWAKPIAVQPYSRSGSRDLSAHLWFRGSIAGYGWRVSSPIVTQPHSMVPTGFISYEKQWLLGGKDFPGGWNSTVQPVWIFPWLMHGVTLIWVGELSHKDVAVILDDSSKFGFHPKWHDWSKQLWLNILEPWNCIVSYPNRSQIHQTWVAWSQKWVLFPIFGVRGRCWWWTLSGTCGSAVLKRHGNLVGTWWSSRVAGRWGSKNKNDGFWWWVQNVITSVYNRMLYGDFYRTSWFSTCWYR